jgi:putative oligomerization/nucleic acid binding protein
MPPLLRGMARTAVVAGTATAVSGRVARRQNQRWAQEEQASQPQQGYPQEAYAPPPAPPSATDDRDRQIAQLKELADLKTQGVLTEEEFAAQKAQILGS